MLVLVCACACVCACTCVCVLVCMCVYHHDLCAYGKEGLILCFSCPEVIEVSCVHMYVCL